MNKIHEILNNKNLYSRMLSTNKGFYINNYKENLGKHRSGEICYT